VLEVRTDEDVYSLARKSSEIHPLFGEAVTYLMNHLPGRETALTNEEKGQVLRVSMHGRTARELMVLAFAVRVEVLRRSELEYMVAAEKAATIDKKNWNLELASRCRGEIDVNTGVISSLLKEWSNQPAQSNAGSRPVSNDSPASAASSAPAPRG
jgi:hypothetical protein